MTPRASILLPAWQAERTLGAALESIRRQSDPDFECVIADDGSTDRTASIARAHAATDPRFRLVSLPHQGLVATLNAGLDHCRGKYTVRFDADDLMTRHRLRDQLDYLEKNPTLAAAGAHVRFFPRSQMSEGLRAYERWLCAMRTPDDVLREAFIECPLAHPTLAIRTEVLQQLRYRDLGWPEDYDLVLRLLTQGHRTGVVPKRLHHWRDGPARLSRTDPSYGIDRFTRCKAYFLAHTHLAGHENYVLWGHGPTGRALKRALRTHHKTPSHIIEIHPRRLGNAIQGAPVVPPDALETLRGAPIVVSVAKQGPRSEVRAWLEARGFREPRDYVCAA